MRTPRPRHLRPFLAVASALVGLLILGRAEAQHLAPTVIEQHWELLGETRTSTAVNGSATLVLFRGVIPGGSTKFEPQPTLTIEVVGRVTGALAGTSWTVGLEDDAGGVLGQVPFFSSDASYSIKTGLMTWPLTDKSLARLRLQPSAASAGTLEVRKAYLKITQNGTLKKTVGRVPIASRQTVTTRQWKDVDDLVFYKHFADDYNPAPTIKLRVAAVWGGAEDAYFRLVDSAGSVVPGSDGVVIGHEAETGPLTLADGRLYKLEVRLSLPPFDPGLGTWDLLSADLVFEQTTTEAHGLFKTVGWYASVTAPMDITNDGADLTFMFNAPAENVRSRRGIWFGTVKVGNSDNQLDVTLRDRDRSVGYTTISTRSTTYAYEEGTLVPAVEAGQDLDSWAVRRGSLASGRVSMTALRVAYELRDTTGPTISDYAASPNPFSPNVPPDGSKDTTELRATLSDVSPPISWTLTIRNASGATVRSYAGSGTSVSQVWDGKDSLGVVPDGTYTATLTATDEPGNSSSADRMVTVDTVRPTISGYSAGPTPFSPNSDGYLDTATLSGTISESLPWTLQIKDSSGFPVRTFAGIGASVAEVWDGASVPDGAYNGVLTATDPAGNAGTASATVTRDTTGPAVSGYVASNAAFSPNVPPDGSKDTTELRATLADAWAPTDWRLDIKSGPSTVRTYTGTVLGTSGTLEQVWDGKNSADQVVTDGVYAATLTATDAGRNARSSSVSVRVDTTAPLLALVAPRAGGNTLFTTQPIVAQVVDRMLETVAPPGAPATSPVPGDVPASGIDATSIDVVVRDLSGAQADQRLTTTLTGNLVRSQPATLVPGSRYEVTVSVRDNAGTRAERVGTVLAMRATSTTLPQVRIASQAPGATEPGGPTDLVDRYVWDAPVTTAGSFTVRLEDTLHKGDGHVSVRFATSTAEVTYTVNGVSGLPVHPVENEAQLAVPFSVGQTGTVSVQTSEHSDETGRLTALVPKGADAGSVRLRMDPVTAAGTAFPVCADPSAAANCVPDPLSTFGRQEEEWGPWAGLMDADPYVVPQKVGELIGLSLPANSCTGTPPSLSDSIAHLGTALGTPDALASGVSLSPELSEGLARIVECMAKHVPLLPEVTGSVSDAQRAEWLAAQRDVLSTIKAFPQNAAFGAGCQVIDSPLGALEVCGSTADTHSQDRFLIVDQAGNDTYTNNAAGAIMDPTAGITRPLAVVLDLAGSDVYNQSRTANLCRLYPSVGAGVRGGVGILVDAGGGDTYVGKQCSQGSADGGAGYLLDLGDGSDAHSTPSTEAGYFNVGTAANGGFGLLVDAGSVPTYTDRYITYGLYNVGYGDLRSVGLVIGGVGNSTYSNRAATNTTTSGWGVGAGSATGVGAILDPGGQDSYTCGTVANYCLAGAIDYSAGPVFANRASVALVIDRGVSNDVYTLGSGSIGGLGRSLYGEALAVLMDAGGADSYSCSATSCFGVGTLEAEALFLDLGAAGPTLPDDTYTCVAGTRRPYLSSAPSSGSCPGRRNNAVWIGESPANYFGAGVDLVGA